VPGTPCFIEFFCSLGLFWNPYFQSDFSSIFRAVYFSGVPLSSRVLGDDFRVPPRGQTRLKLTFPAKRQKIDEKMVTKFHQILAWLHLRGRVVVRYKTGGVEGLRGLENAVTIVVGPIYIWWFLQNASARG
jgi:hypothetical protein